VRYTAGLMQKSSEAETSTEKREVVDLFVISLEETSEREKVIQITGQRNLIKCFEH
jgi:hypothetical protein